MASERHCSSRTGGQRILVEAHLDRIPIDDLFESYLIHDGDGVTFSAAQDGSLVLTGQPRFHTFAFERSGVTPRETLNTWLAQNRRTLKAINPAVWNAGTTTMRYAAFFRYCKKTDSAMWAGFLKSLDGVIPHPTVKTPDVVR
jgi:hypothetical protein